MNEVIKSEIIYQLNIVKDINKLTDSKILLIVLEYASSLTRSIYIK